MKRSRMRRSAALGALVAAGAWLGGCPPAATNPPDGAAAPTSTAVDPLDERPELGPVRPYRAPEPLVYTTSQGLTVWLIERHQLPLVSLCLAVPFGSAEDPPGKAGLAHVTASMLDEGAGDRDALAISSAIADLGAQLRIAVSPDGSRARLTVLRRFFDQGFDVFANIVSRPHFDPDEWARVSGLWKNQLLKRADDPGAVAGLVGQAVLYGPDTPYGHPTSGQLDAAESLGLNDIKAFYQRTWRPDRALLVAAGDVTRAQLDAAIARSLGGWTKPAAPAPERVAAPVPLERRPRLVLVDRPQAPQAVIMLVRAGVAAADPAAPLLELINTALGGSFTSRLNQSLREERGWSYGAGSAFVLTRGVGPFVAQAAVETRYTAAAVRQMRFDIERMRQAGLTEDEYVKTRAQDLTGLIETHQTIDRLAWRLGRLAMLGLPPGHDALASRARQQASRAELAQLAAANLDTQHASVVVVGPRAKLTAQLRAMDLGEPEAWGTDGRPLARP
jgi:predicted Zn-dependent peptidase